MSVPGAATGLSAKAIAGIVIGSVVVIGAAGGIAFAATDGFGLLSEPPSSSEAGAAPDSSPSPEIVPGERPEDGIIEDALTMDTAFNAGKSVECYFSYEAYEGTATLKSKDIFRVDQESQGGLFHIIRSDETTYLWFEGMTQAEEFDTSEFLDLRDPLLNAFDPAAFEAVLVDDPSTCVEIPAASDELFTLPDGMTSSPGRP